MPVQTVLVFDICSSTSIIEDLHRTGQTDRYEELIQEINRFLRDNENRYDYITYKFVGDGFILLFAGSKAMDLIVTFSMALVAKCQEHIAKFVSKYLETMELERIGLTAGIDKGEVFKTKLHGSNANEYFGRPINVACRLQSSLDRPEHANKVLMSKRCYQEIESRTIRMSCAETKRKLKNVNSTKEIRCYEFSPLYFKTRELSDLRSSAENAITEKLKGSDEFNSEVAKIYQIAANSTSTMSSIVSVGHRTK